MALSDSDILGRFEGVVRAGDGAWKALCPCHEDQNPSLSLTRGRKGWVCHCHACGVEGPTVWPAVGLTWPDVTFSSDSPGPGPSPGVRRVSPEERAWRAECYGRLLGALALSTAHFAALAARGLSPEQILHNGYKTLESPTGHAQKVLDELYDEYGDLLWKLPGVGARPYTGPQWAVREGIAVPVRSAAGQVLGLQVRRDARKPTDAKYLWMSTRDNPCGSPVHWPRGSLEKYQETREIRITEGPLKADVVWHLDPSVAVVGLSTASDVRKAEAIARRLSPEVARIALDADWRTNEAVYKSLLKVRDAIGPYCRDVRIENWDPRIAKGLDDLLASGHRPEILTSPTPTVRRKGGRKSLVECADTLDTTHTIPWLWNSWLPANALVMLEADPGLGKGYMVNSIVAALSIGGDLPGHPSVSKTNTLFISAEDPLNQIMGPRLHLAGADRSRVFFWRGMELDDNGNYRLPVLPDDLDELVELVKTLNIGLVVFDPITAHFARGFDVNCDQDVRQVLTPLADKCEQHNFSVLAIRHLSKRTDVGPLHRGAGSVGFTASARVVWGMLRRPEDPKTDRVVYRLKANWAPDGRALVGRLPVEYAEDGSPLPTCWEWHPEIKEERSYEHILRLLRDQNKPQNRRREEAVNMIFWLGQLLLDRGPLTKQQIMEEVVKVTKNAKHPSWDTIRSWMSSVPAVYDGPSHTWRLKFKQRGEDANAADDPQE